MNGKILIVDDSSTDRAIISGILYDYDLFVAKDGIEALEIIEENPSLDLVILDLNMPRMNGFEVLERINDRPDTKRVSVVILTNYEEVDQEIKGLALGAVDYIRKPLNVESLRKRVEVHLNLTWANKKIEKYNQELEEEVLQRTKELIITRNVTIHALIGLLEARDIESSNHTRRTQGMMRVLSLYLKNKGSFTDVLTDDYIIELCDTAPLHDIGKVAIADSILLKEGKLNNEEYELMKKHVDFGVEALTHETNDRDTVSFIKTAIEIVGSHHEKFDGTGYPKGLKGNEIPLAGRLMAIIDVYDALTTKRVYKPAFDHQFSLDLIRNQSGRHFDPLIVEAFLEIENLILNISQKFIQELS